MFFGDRVGWEGDDLAIIESSTHLDVKPFDTLYRYPWQPLSIRAAHWLTRHGVPALSLTYLPNILGAIGIVALAETLAVILGTSTGVWIAYGLVLAIPELWITILYFNTTALGLPFFCGAFLLLAPAVRNEKAWFWRVALAAILYAVSCLFRLDFATASLALLLIVYALTPVRKWFAVLLFMFVSGTVGLAGLLYLGAGPAEILRTFRFYEGEPQSEKLSIVIFLLGVLPLALMSPVLVREIARRKWPCQPAAFWVLVVLSTLPLVFPLKALYSAKYLVPAFCTGLIALALLLRQPAAQTADPATASRSAQFAPSTIWFLASALLISYLLGVQIDRTTRHVSVAFAASTFRTADGERPLGGYVSFVRMFREPTDRPVYILLHREIAQWIERSPGDAVVVLREPYDGPEKETRAPLVNFWTWGWPTLYLQERGWVLDEYVDKQRISMVAPDGRKAHIIKREDAAIDLPAHACMIEIGPVRLGHEQEDMARFTELLSAASCKPDAR